MIVNIAAYHFVAIDAPAELAEHLRARAEAEGLLGTILVAGEGINVFLAGTATGIERFIEALRLDPRFADIVIKRSFSTGQPFGRLKAKVKAEIIRFGQADSDPLRGRAETVAPAVLARWIEAGHDDEGRPLRLLDTRNREEVAHGSFIGAVSLPIDRFTDFPAAVEAQREALADARIVSFCTGGVRCEKAALWMQARGFEHVVQLDGGILGYFEQVGGFGYAGHCFVFDERVALDPGLRGIGESGA